MRRDEGVSSGNNNVSSEMRKKRRSHSIFPKQQQLSEDDKSQGAGVQLPTLPLTSMYLWGSSITLVCLNFLLIKTGEKSTLKFTCENSMR